MTDARTCAHHLRARVETKSGLASGSALLLISLATVELPSAGEHPSHR
jgi:hypothetical protein